MKALALISGGLDSLLAAKLIQEQNIKVIGFYFTAPFISGKLNTNPAKIAAKQLKIPIKTISIDSSYLKMLRNPKHGYGSEMNPCVDCKIFILKKAKQYAEKIGAKFIVTGEVLGQRPMSQLLHQLMLIEKQADLKGKIVRPLSAKLLPETEAERNKWINREKLLDIRGRGRLTQLELAKKYKISNYSTPAGGCYLTHKEYTPRLKDLFSSKKSITEADLELLNLGRHFRFGKSKIIVGRNESENKKLIKFKSASDFVFEVKKCGSPTTLLQGKKTKGALKFAAEATASYSDCEKEVISVNCKHGNTLKKINAEKIHKEFFNKFRL